MSAGNVPASTTKAAMDAGTAAAGPTKSQLEGKAQCMAVATVTGGGFMSATCYMTMMFFALSTAINCVVLDKSLDDPVDQWCVSASLFSARHPTSPALSCTSQPRV